MVRTRLALLVVLCLVVAPAVSPSAGARTRTSQPALTKSLRSPYVALDRTGAIALDAATGEVLYGHNETLPLVPASNEKLPVAWTALILLGPAYRFHTDVVGRGERLGATWNGDLFITGNGDPTLTGQDIGRLAAAVRAAGIRRITGRIRGDESAYDARRGAPGWKHYFIGGESPPLSALVVDRARGWPALSPPLLAAKALRAALVARGVAVAGRPGLGVAPRQADDDCRRPLAEPRVHRPGDGPRQRQLRRGDAAQAPRDARRRRGNDGARRARRASRDADGRHPGQGVRIVDGSGLSSLDRLTPAALAGVIRAGMQDPRIGSAFVASFAIAGRTGTLESRLPRLTGVVRGKTGTTDLACSLSGVIGDGIVFSVLQNGSPVSFWSARTAQDRFVTALARSPYARTSASPARASAG